MPGPHLYQIDPSGSFWAWKASAIGKNMVNAKTFLEKRYNEDIEIEDAIHTAILTLKVTPPAPPTGWRCEPRAACAATERGAFAPPGGVRGPDDGGQH